MDTLTIWILALIGFGLFVYFVPYRNIKIVQNKLDKIIELKGQDFKLTHLLMSVFTNFFYDPRSLKAFSLFI